MPALAAAGYRVITYDRRGFGRSDKPPTGYTYDTLTEDLHALLEELDLNDVTLVGFSMGGGEVARYFAKYGSERIHSAVFASAIPPYMLTTADNPDGPLEKSKAAKMTAELTASEHDFYEQFTTDFREDLPHVTVPTLVLHGDRDGIVPFEGSGARTHAAISGSEVAIIEGAPHGANDSHAEEWNRALLDFLSAHAR